MRATRTDQVHALREDQRPQDQVDPEGTTVVDAERVPDAERVADAEGQEVASSSPLVAGHPKTGASSRPRDGEVVEFWSDQTANGLRERWRDLQLRFVDDPRAATTEADAVLKETIEAISQSLQTARADLSDWRDQHDADTEGLRLAMQRYRAVLDRLLSL